MHLFTFCLQEKQFPTKRRHSIEILVTPKPVDPYEEQENKARENRLILERFKEAWKPPIKILIVDLSLVTYIDSVAVKTLTAVSI